MFNKNFSKEPTDKQKIGQKGEDEACFYLEKKGYKVIERNYLKKWGEIDIVCKKNSKIHFVEVKTVSRDLSEPVLGQGKEVIHETSNRQGMVQGDAVRGGKGTERGVVQQYGDESSFLPNKEMRPMDNSDYRAEDNMHPWKLQRLGRAVQSYLLDRDISENVDWQFDVVTVHLDQAKGLSEIYILPDVVL